MDHCTVINVVNKVNLINLVALVIIISSESFCYCSFCINYCCELLQPHHTERACSHYACHTWAVIQTVLYGVFKALKIQLHLANLKPAGLQLAWNSECIQMQGQA